MFRPKEGGEKRCGAVDVGTWSRLSFENGKIAQRRLCSYSLKRSCGSLQVVGKKRKKEKVWLNR